MFLVRTFSCSTMIAGLIHQFVKSFRPYGHFVCARCGLSIEFHHQDGEVTSSLTLISASRLPNPSPCRHSVNLTREGNVSIYCAPSEFGKAASLPGSGSAEQTYSSAENSEPPLLLNGDVNVLNYAFRRNNTGTVSLSIGMVNYSLTPRAQDTETLKDA